jgi:hypothetical protein
MGPLAARIWACKRAGRRSRHLESHLANVTFPATVATEQAHATDC